MEQSRSRWTRAITAAAWVWQERPLQDGCVCWGHLSFCSQKVPGERLKGEIQCSSLLSASPIDVYTEQAGLPKHASLFQIHKIK